MQLTLEPTKVAIDEGGGALARVWLGRLDDGAQVLLPIPRLPARDARQQDQIDADLRRIGPPTVIVSADELEQFLTDRAREQAA